MSGWSDAAFSGAVPAGAEAPLRRVRRDERRPVQFGNGGMLFVRRFGSGEAAGTDRGIVCPPVCPGAASTSLPVRRDGPVRGSG